MRTVKTFVGQSQQIISHTQMIEAGDEIQMQGIDTEFVGNEPVSIPWAVRLSTDAIYEMLIYFGSKAGWLHRGQENKLVSGDSDLWPPKQMRLMAKNKNKIEWGMEDISDEIGDNLFETRDNSIVVPFNSDITDRKYKLLNSGLLDDNQYCPQIMNQVRSPRPFTVKYENDNKTICVTFMPSGPEGFKMENYADQGWKNGAHFTWKEDGEFTIHKKGTVDYLIPVHDATITNSTLGHKIPSGAPVELTSDFVVIEPSTNILLHIYR